MSLLRVSLTILLSKLITAHYGYMRGSAAARRCQSSAHSVPRPSSFRYVSPPIMLDSFCFHLRLIHVVSITYSLCGINTLRVTNH